MDRNTYVQGRPTPNGFYPLYRCVWLHPVIATASLTCVSLTLAGVALGAVGLDMGVPLPVLAGVGVVSGAVLGTALWALVVRPSQYKQ
eukprot:m51a1_g2887 hypothetical protein (88) ;mRNA; f:419864-420202